MTIRIVIVRMKIELKYISTTILGFITLAVLFTDSHRLRSMLTDSNTTSARAPASEEDELDPETREMANEIRDYFLPHSYRTQEMIDIAIEHITPGESHEIDAENPPPTSRRGANHAGHRYAYNPLGADGDRSPRCLQAVNDAAVESRQFTERIDTVSACFGYAKLNSQFQNLLLTRNTHPSYTEFRRISPNENRLELYGERTGQMLPRDSWNYQVQYKRWEHLLTDPKMAPRGAILLYVPHESIGLCAHIDGQRGHIEIKTADAGEHGYVSVSLSNRPAYGLRRTLIGVYVKMVELDYEDVELKSESMILTDIDVNFNQSSLGQGNDIIYGGSNRLTFKRKDCLREARAILFHSKRAFERMRNRETWGSLNKIKRDIEIAYDKTTYDREEDWGSGTPGDNTTWGVSSCVKFPYEYTHSIQAKLDSIRTLLRNPYIEPHQDEIIQLMGEVIGRDSNDEPLEVNPIKNYYDLIRANSDNHLSD